MAEPVFVLKINFVAVQNKSAWSYKVTATLWGASVDFIKNTFKIKAWVEREPSGFQLLTSNNFCF